jgi:hypothetical protein
MCKVAETSTADLEPGLSSELFIPSVRCPNIVALIKDTNEDLSDDAAAHTAWA